MENTEKEKTAAGVPSSYGKTEAFLLPKDPSWLFMLWEVTASTYDYIKSQNGFDVFEKSKPVIRLHDVTDIKFDGYNSHNHTDISVILSANSWYIQAPAPGRSYAADLGIITQDGRFILLARSNSVLLPSGKVSDIVDEKWMLVEGDYRKLLIASGANFIGLGASELAQALNEKWRLTESIPSSYTSSNKSSKEFTSIPLTSEEDEIWLKADCEIIIYGSASPKAKVKINGKEITLDNGSFSLRQSLHKGESIDLPITAETNSLKKSLRIKAERED
jgi:hypothetical protein